MGWKWFPTVAWMCDESFAINMATKLPDDVDEKWFYFHVSWLNYVFWVFSTFVGGLFGNLLTSVDLRGIDFVLQGLFIVVFLEMLLNAKNNKIRAFGVAGEPMAVAMLSYWWEISLYASIYELYLWFAILRTNGEVCALTNMKWL